LASPQPRRSCGYLCGPGGQGIEDSLVVLGKDHLRMLTVASLASFLNRFGRRNPILGGGAIYLFKQIANNLVTDSGYSYPPTLFHKLDDHASPGKRLARARRPLDRKHRSLTRKQMRQGLSGFRQLLVL